MPETVRYKSFNGEQYQLYPHVGSHMTLLTPSTPDQTGWLRKHSRPARELDPAVVARIVKVVDAAYEGYRDLMGGREPQKLFQAKGRATIAVVRETCGAGCGYLGQTGIEIQESYWWQLYEGMAERNEMDQIPFYELGRNFWLLEDKLGYVEPDRGGGIVTGFAVVNRFLVMDTVGIAPGPFNGEPFAAFRRRVEELVHRYEADTSLTWDNTLRTEQGVPGSGLGATDLFASMVLDLGATFGQDFYQRLWVEALAQPDRITTRDAVDNFVRAASAAAGQDLTTWFTKKWRFPESQRQSNGPNLAL